MLLKIISQSFSDWSTVDHLKTRKTSLWDHTGWTMESNYVRAAIHVIINPVPANRLYWLRVIGPQSGMISSLIHLSITILQDDWSKWKDFFVSHTVDWLARMSWPGWRNKIPSFLWIMKMKDWEDRRTSCVISFFSFSASHFKRQDMQNSLQWIFKVLAGWTRIVAAGKTDETGALLSSVVVII